MGRGGQRHEFPVLLQHIPDFRQGGVTLKYVKRGYHVLCTHALTLLLLPLELANMLKTGQLREMWVVASQTHLQFNMVVFMGCCLLLAIMAVTYVLTRTKPVYLINYHCYKPPDRSMFNEQSLQFQEKIMERSGLGDETYLPEAVQQIPPQISMAAAREEAEMVLFDSVRNVLEEAKLKPGQVDILVVNCSLFNPTPSLSAMIINHFKMRSNIVSYNLAGMGCSAGVIAVYPGSRALVVSTENITQNWYFGNERSMLIPNCLFRVGGAALLLSNKRKDYWRAKYELLHVVRTHMGANDQRYGCVYQREDSKGRVGVHLSKELMAIAGHALKANITTLGPLVLPVSEQLIFFGNLVARKVFKMKIKGYIPDFKLAFEHFCIHTGGRGVIEEIEKQLQLAPDNVQPSKDTLFRYGNTSSSSIWYVLSNIESKRGIRKGDRIWQIAFGSGFKCNSAVWRSMRNNNQQHTAWDDTPKPVEP
ncbi:MAG: beta-ketoacyl-coa synthase family [Trebouxia sp. A1-2]|nr:MAG: beta-ketoacyl-coa synthase family [Trebouxia sp. A1-2]